MIGRWDTEELETRQAWAQQRNHPRPSPWDIASNAPRGADAAEERGVQAQLDPVQRMEIPRAKALNSGAYRPAVRLSPPPPAVPPHG
mgnify:CR=1 FL=1